MYQKDILKNHTQIFNYKLPKLRPEMFDLIFIRIDYSESVNV